MWLFLWLGCAPEFNPVVVPPLDLPTPTDSTETPVVDTDSETLPTPPTGTTPTTSTGSGTGLPAGLTGTVPDVALAAPAFELYNRDQTLRTDADLMGHPTVMWFYPSAGGTG